jgi:CRISPR-associated protein Csb2
MLNIGAKWQVGIIQAHLPNREPEIPPHPERLVEALLSSACLRDDGGLAHRRALRTLEGCAPAVCVTPSIGKAGVTLARFAPYIENPGKDPFVAACAFETHPRIVAGDLHVVYSYDLPVEGEEAALIREMMAGVFYLGESESAVTLKFVESIPDDFVRYVPCKGEYAGIPMRVPRKGRLDLLESSYETRMARVVDAMEKNKPELAYRQWSEFREINDLVDVIAYRRAADIVDSPLRMHEALFADGGEPANIDPSNFDEMLADCRSAWLDSLRVQAPELTGHETNGAPTTRPHVGFVPLFDCSRPYATGAMQGFAIVIPSIMPAALAEEAAAALARTVNVRRSNSAIRVPLVDPATYRAERGRRGQPKLRVAERMRGDGRTWVTITPVVPWRYSKPKRLLKDPDTMLPIIQEIFERAGLPQPIDVRWGPSSPLVGTQHVAALVNKPTCEGKPLPRPMHLVFTFDRPVRGPIVLGRRAWKGYGACLPIK